MKQIYINSIDSILNTIKINWDKSIEWNGEAIIKFNKEFLTLNEKQKTQIIKSNIENVLYDLYYTRGEITTLHKHFNTKISISEFSNKIVDANFSKGWIDEGWTY